MSVTDSAKIRDFIYNYFEIAKTKEIKDLPGFFHSNFTKFGDSPPYDLRELDRAMMLEQLQFAGISDYNFKIEEMKIEVVGEVGISTFTLDSTGLIVDDYSFRGTAVKNKARVTIVLQKDKKGGWKMLHQHFSKMPC